MNIAQDLVGLQEEATPRATQCLFISGDDLMTGEDTARYLVSGLIEEGTTGQLFGPSGAGKTFVALDLALCVATGTNFDGHQTKQGLVLFLAGEGRSGFKRRMRAWAKHHVKTINDTFCLSNGRLSLDDKGILAVIAEGKRRSEKTRLRVALIVIDTLVSIGFEN